MQNSSVLTQKHFSELMRRNRPTPRQSEHGFNHAHARHYASCRKLDALAPHDLYDTRTLWPVKDFFHDSPRRTRTLEGRQPVFLELHTHRPEITLGPKRRDVSEARPIQKIPPMTFAGIGEHHVKNHFAATMFTDTAVITASASVVAPHEHCAHVSVEAMAVPTAAEMP
jgi:hypothetical protein